MNDSRKMLGSVDKFTEGDYQVKFRPCPKDSFIRNLETGRKVYLRKERGIYLPDVFLLKDGKKVPGNTIIDSGAAECVMPKAMLPKIPLKEKKASICFAAASGGEMGNY